MSLAASETDALRDAFHDAARTGRRVLPAGGRTKPGLSVSAAEDVVSLDTRGLSGIVEYDPRELTMTALAGTPVAEVREALAAHGQHLPFDPPLCAAGATLGGVVATGAGGPCALRHGGVRDFLIGVRFLDGTGTLVGGGGRVVKNAAGFDLPKLMVGSIGRLGVLVRLSFKVFPEPPARTTAIIEHDELTPALTTIARLGRGPLAIEAIDLLPPTGSSPARLFVRVECPRETVAARLADVAGVAPSQLLVGAEERALWSDATELSWAPEGSDVLRAPLTPSAAHSLIASLGDRATVRFTLACNAAWIAWPADQPIESLDATLTDLGLGAAHLIGPSTRPLIGAVPTHAFARRIRAALDPDGRFPED